MAQNIKILIIRLSSIGDIIQCSGATRCLKTTFPHSEIHWVVRSDNEDLVKLNSFVDRVVSFQKSEGLKGWIKLAKHLQGENYTHIYDAHNNLRSFVMTLFLRAPHFVRRSKSRIKRFLLFTFKINFFKNPYRPAESFVQPLKSWDVNYDGLGGEMTLPPNLIEKLKKNLPSGPMVALAPATAWPKKTWPLAYWKDLVRSLLEKTNLKLVILGGPGDTFCSELVLDSARVFSYQGRSTLLESAALASLCNTLIAADTGLLHMAEALKINVVALMGPTPFGFPSRVESVILEKKLWCRPCSKDGSGICINRVYQKCMKEIRPSEAFEAVKKKAL